MHPFSLSEQTVARMVAKQGRAHTIEHVVPARTALIVVDMQNYFMAPGQQFETPTARAIVPNVNRLARALRDAGGSVVWIENVATTDRDGDVWPSYAERYVPEQWARRRDSLTPGNFGFELWPELDVRPGDMRVRKNRFSAFSPGASDLAARLRAASIDTLLVTGVATNICCETTARDGMMLDFTVGMVSDGCAAPDDDLHANALTNFYLTFGDVQTTAAYCALLAQVRRGAA